MVLTHGEVAADDAPAASPVLRTLVLFEHALFLLLVSVGFLRALLTGATPWPVVAGTFLLIAWYAVGARRLIRPPQLRTLSRPPDKGEIGRGEG